MKIRVPFQGWKRGRWHWLTKSLESRKFAVWHGGNESVRHLSKSGGEWWGGLGESRGRFPFSFFPGGSALLSWFSGFSGEGQDWKPEYGSLDSVSKWCLPRKPLPNQIRLTLLRDGETPGEGVPESAIGNRGEPWPSVSASKEVSSYKDHSPTVSGKWAKIKSMDHRFRHLL